MRKPLPAVARDLSTFSSLSLALAAARGLLPAEHVAAERLRRRELRIPWEVGGPADPHGLDLARLAEWRTLGLLDETAYQAEFARRTAPRRYTVQGRRR